MNFSSVLFQKNQKLSKSHGLTYTYLFLKKVKYDDFGTDLLFLTLLQKTATFIDMGIRDNPETVCINNFWSLDTGQVTVMVTVSHGVVTEPSQKRWKYSNCS